MVSPVLLFSPCRAARQASTRLGAHLEHFPDGVFFPFPAVQLQLLWSGACPRLHYSCRSLPCLVNLAFLIGKEGSHAILSAHPPGLPVATRAGAVSSGRRPALCGGPPRR